jgi:hypothetical protein
MFAALAKFRTIDRAIRRAVARPVGLVACNDNLNRSTAVRPRLAARWSRNPGNGRLQCRWSLERTGSASATDPEPSEPAALHNGQRRVRSGHAASTHRISFQARSEWHQVRRSRPRVRAAGSAVI